MKRAAPLPRRHMGDFEYRYRDGTVRKVAVYVNAEEVGRWLAKRAHESKGKRSVSIHGAVLVEAL